MASSFVITLREGLEAVLVISIVLACLSRTGHDDKRAIVWTGVGLSVALSLLVGAMIFAAAGSIEGRAEEVFEGTAMVAAAAVLTYMIFWMRRQAINVHRSLQAQVRTALESGSRPALGLLAFVAVGREGIETVLFLFAAAETTTPAAAAVGGLLGLAVAIAIGYLLYQGTYRLNLRAFFSATSVLLLQVAAGLLSHGIHEFAEAGMIPPLVDPLWDINWLLDERSLFGSFLGALLGYNGNPSLAEVLGYTAYLALVGWGHFRPATARELGAVPERVRA